jgi:hypothetical protein
MEDLPKTEFESYVDFVRGDVDAIIADAEIAALGAPARMTMELKHSSLVPQITVGKTTVEDVINHNLSMGFEEAGERAELLNSAVAEDFASLYRHLLGVARRVYVEEQAADLDEKKLESIQLESQNIDAGAGTNHWGAFELTDDLSFRVSTIRIDDVDVFGKIESVFLVKDDSIITETLKVARIGEKIVIVERNYSPSENELSLRFFQLFPNSYNKMMLFLKGDFESEEELDTMLDTVRSTFESSAAEESEGEEMLNLLRERAVVAMGTRHMGFMNVDERPAPAAVHEFRQALEALIQA